jgi:hypothetical protein
MHARFKLVKAKADISNENKSVKRFDKVGDDLGKIDLGAKRFVFITSPAQYRIIALKLLSTVAVPTGKVFDMAITLDKFGVQLRVDVLSGSNWNLRPFALGFKQGRVNMETKPMNVTLIVSSYVSI